MECFVTGASGFIGSNLVHELIARGHRVTVLARRGSDLRTLDGLKFKRVEGDLSDSRKLTDAMSGCDWCFHVAASYFLWMRDYAPMYETNVNGTRNVLEAAATAGCSRIVYTSTVGCIGLPKPFQGRIIPSDEATPVSESQMKNPYKHSKWQAEQIAFEFVRKGVPIVIVNPSGPIGPRDSKPTPTGQMIVDFLNRKMPAYIDTGLNWVHVRDVAVGHILAAKEGRVGERYILGNEEGNWTMKHTFEVLEEVSGVPSPKRQIPHWVAIAAGHVNETFSRITGIPPKVPLAGARMGGYKMWFNPGKAIRELGLPQTPPKEAFAEAVEWYRKNGRVFRT
jgi:dihydroflavonol-4-reductase